MTSVGSHIVSACHTVIAISKVLPLGYLVMGPIVDALGYRPAAATCTAVTLAVAAAVAAGSGVRGLRRDPSRV